MSNAIFKDHFRNLGPGKQKVVSRATRDFDWQLEIFFGDVGSDELWLKRSDAINIQSNLEIKEHIDSEQHAFSGLFFFYQLQGC